MRYSPLLLLLIMSQYVRRATQFAIGLGGGTAVSWLYASRAPQEQPSPATRVAFLGNSFLYFNDCPRLLEAISGGAVSSSSCTRGGATLQRLTQQGGDPSDFACSPNAARADGTLDAGETTVADAIRGRGGLADFVILQDHSQAPARPAKRARSAETLKQTLGPMISASGARPVLVATWAYRAPTKGSDDLGDTTTFTAALAAGVSQYSEWLAPTLPAERVPLIAPVGSAFLSVQNERPALWRELFDPDDFHPSPHGSYLQACVLHCVIFGAPPPLASAVPAEPATLWRRARRMQPPDQPPLRLPTREELDYLRAVAARCCGVVCA